MANAFSQLSACRKKGAILRSNRPLTEFGCVRLENFLTASLDANCQFSNGNTTVLAETDGHLKSFRVLLFGEEILEVLLCEQKPASIKVSFTTFYDHFGQPTTTTVERLNGLLDRLGVYGILPTGTRVFRGPCKTMTYLGHGDNKIAVGEDYAHFVYIRPSIDELDIVSGFFSREVGK